MEISINMQPVQKIIERHGLGQNGRVQLFMTTEINRRITKYMPYLTGVLSEKSKRIISPTKIKVDGPYAKYMYYGKAMIGAAPKTKTDKDLNYTKTFHPDAGPYWDRRLMSAEGKAIAKAVEKYIKRG